MITQIRFIDDTAEKAQKRGGDLKASLALTGLKKIPSAWNLANPFCFDLTAEMNSNGLYSDYHCHCKGPEV